MAAMTTERLHGLDAVRGGALLLGIFFHAGFSFFPGDTFWLIMDTQRSAALSGLAFVLHIFRMTLFFILAGYFGRMQAERLGTVSFAKDRLKRIGAPILIFWPVMIASLIALAIWGFLVSHGGVVPESTPPPPPLSVETFPLTHLWFLYMLLIFYGGMLISRKVIVLLDRRGFISGATDTCLRQIAKTPFLPLLLALPLAWALNDLTVWYPFFGIPTPDKGFVPNLASLIGYGSAFLIGWVLHRQSGLLQKVSCYWPLYLFTALILTSFCLSTIGTNLTYGQFLTGSTKTLYALGYTVATWTWAFGLIGLSLKLMSGHSAARRYIADASYWLYLIHLPIVIILQIWVSQWALPAELKYLLILGVSLPLMLLSYHVLVRFTFIGALLNGRKKQRQITPSVISSPVTETL